MVSDSESPLVESRASAATTRPLFSVIIGTRNRGATIVPAVESVLRNDYSTFELLIVDQSNNAETENAIKDFLVDKRLKYVRSKTRGVSRGQNLACAMASGQYFVMTDDDCTVPNDWLTVILDLFGRYSTVGTIFCSVAPGQHDANRGFIPSIQFEGDRFLRSLSDFRRHLGIGAGLAVRREVFEALGGFDETLGPGGRLKSGADQDLGIRTLINDWHVLLTDETTVTHHGFRTWEEGKHLIDRYYFGSGAFCVKPLKAGKLGILYHIAYRLGVDALWKPFSLIFQGKRPRGFRRFFAFWRGFWAGACTPFDKRTLRYIE